MSGFSITLFLQREHATSQTTQYSIFLFLFSYKNGISSLIQIHFEVTQIKQNQINLSSQPTPNLQKANFLKKALTLEQTHTVIYYTDTKQNIFYRRKTAFICLNRYRSETDYLSFLFPFFFPKKCFKIYETIFSQFILCLGFVLFVYFYMYSTLYGYCTIFNPRSWDREAANASSFVFKTRLDIPFISLPKKSRQGTQFGLDYLN